MMMMGKYALAQQEKEMNEWMNDHCLSSLSLLLSIENGQKKKKGEKEKRYVKRPLLQKKCTELL